MLRSAYLKGIALLSVIAVSAGALLLARSGPDRLDRDRARAELAEFVQQVHPQEAFITWRAKVPLGERAAVEDSLPDINRFPLVVDPPVTAADLAAEIFVSIEKAGKGADGWMVALAEEFNRRAIRLSNGRRAKVKIRHIPSGTGYQFIGSGKYRPDAFSPSNHLWIRMSEARGTAMAPVRERLVRNLAGVVMKRQAAADLRSSAGDLNIRSLIDSVVQGKLAMGYTDPFASSTGLNFLLSVLQTFGEGDDGRLLSPEVVSAFEEFQRGVPFVALTTLQMRDSVDRDGSLDAFVMEYQTFVNDPALRSGYEFIPFGVSHDNPLYAVGSPGPAMLELLQAFAALADDTSFVDLARKDGFDPPLDYRPTYAAPPGDLIIKAQKIWKEKKNAGRPIAAVFLCDVSGSMDGVRIRGVREALIKASAFIGPDSSIGMVTFAGDVRIVLPIKRFDLNQKASLLAAADSLQVGGQTAMYDGIAASLWMLAEAQRKQPELKPMLFVLTDGQTNEGLRFSNLRPVIEGLGIPVYTIGYEANLAELQRLSALVEAASLTASKDDIAYKLATLFNAEM